MAMKERHLTRWIALDSKVLVVASCQDGREWSAYIGAVEGKKHDDEWYEVLRHGSKLPRRIAEILFPDFANEYIWRD